MAVTDGVYPGSSGYRIEFGELTAVGHPSKMNESAGR
jgi:hypothetical protein